MRLQVEQEDLFSNARENREGALLDALNGVSDDFVGALLDAAPALASDALRALGAEVGRMSQYETVSGGSRVRPFPADLESATNGERTRKDPPPFFHNET